MADYTTIHVPHLDRGTDPTMHGGQGVSGTDPMRVTYGAVKVDNTFRNGRWAGARGDQTASFTVSYAVNNTITAGEVVLVLGEHRLRPHIDFTPTDADANATAAAIAAAIGALPGFSAVAAGPNVSVSRVAVTDKVPFYVIQHTTDAHLINIVPGDGFMASGGPHPSAPELNT